MSAKVLLVVGTKKGLFLLQSDASRRRWAVSAPHLIGGEVTHAAYDPRTGAVYATANDFWFGQRVAISPDLGKTWRDNKSSPKFPEGSPLKAVEKLWRVEPGRASEPGVVYCGVRPAAMFRSEDGGDSWVEMTALGAHRTRERWFPGAGGLIAHSVVLDPGVKARMWVAISAAGVFRTDDGGPSWQPMNAGLKNVLAKYNPEAEMHPEVGQCVHHLVHAAGSRQRLYAQTHWGAYRGDDGAKSWRDITEGLPSDFGMVMAAHPRDPDVAYVLPLQGAEFRCPPEARLRVYRTQDAGQTWAPLTKGLPQRGAYMGTYREAMMVDALDPAGVYFGTNTGQLYASDDEGDSWRRISEKLPPISCVNAAVLE
ncbi:MAG: exo-alpha-sialidase [SAR202 cluster bacterium]|nr:exo-alpha-sialidase [SAR202 cluster bacterium]